MKTLAMHGDPVEMEKHEAIELAQALLKAAERIKPYENPTR
jgi:hypothetical protein